ncbi:MAG: hypothetical protein EXR67_00710 [Dehalococcoidia bacterium]|nr:hypothetical protein [Dehalococcoidia bacterium]
MLVTLMGLTVFACIIPVERGKLVEGRSLTVGVTQVRKVSEVFYEDQGQHFVIRPRDPEKNTLALTSISIANYRSARVLMSIDSAAAYVDDQQNRQYPVINPFGTQREKLDQPGKDEPLYVPFLWGTIGLDLNTQITGWMVFEVPKATEVQRFGWQQGENIVVRFCKEPC